MALLCTYIVLLLAALATAAPRIDDFSAAKQFMKGLPDKSFQKRQDPNTITIADAQTIIDAILLKINSGLPSAPIVIPAPSFIPNAEECTIYGLEGGLSYKNQSLVETMDGTNFELEIILVNGAPVGLECAIKIMGKSRSIKGTIKTIEITMAVTADLSLTSPALELTEFEFTNQSPVDLEITGFGGPVQLFVNTIIRLVSRIVQPALTRILENYIKSITAAALSLISL